MVIWIGSIVYMGYSGVANMRKYGLTIKDWVIATLMFSAVFTMGVIMIQGFSQDSGIANNLTDPTIISHYDSLDQNLNQINQTIGAVNQPGGMTLASGFQAFLGGTVAVLNIVLGSMNLIPSLFVNFASDFGVPSQVAVPFFAIASAIIAVLIIFAVLNSAKAGGRI